MSVRTIPSQMKAVLTQNMTEAGLTGPDPAVRSRRHIVIYGYSNSLLFNLTAGAFLSGFWLSLNADADWISMVIMLASMANILQILSPVILQWIANPKKVLWIVRVSQHTCNLLAAAVIPLLGFSEQVTLNLVLGFIVIAYILGGLSGPGLQMWHLKSIPTNLRLGFFSFLHATNVIVTFSALFLGGLFTDWVTELASARTAFIILRLLLIVIAAADLWTLTRIEDPDLTGSKTGRQSKSLLQLPRHILAHRVYLFTILAAALWAVSASLPGQYFIVYLISELDFSFSFITGVSLLNLVVIIALTPFWKRIIARFAWMRSFSLSTMLYALGLLAMAFTGQGTPGLILYVVASFYTFVMMLGINLAFSNLTYVNMPEENQASFIALFNSSFHASILLGIWLGNRFMILTSDYANQPMFLGLINAQVLLIVASLLIILSGVIIWQIGRVEKPLE